MPQLNIETHLQHGMQRPGRLAKTSQFAVVFDNGKTQADGLLVLRAMRNGLDFTRYGFVVSKKVGNAVVRNRVRRLMREVARLNPVQQGWDLVFIARSRASQARYSDIESSMIKLWRRASVLEGK